MVVGVPPERLDWIFRALADSTRRDILAVVLHDQYSVSDLARRYPMSFAAVQKHVAVLERTGLVTKSRRGREQRVSGDIETLRQARDVLDRLELLWRQRIDSVDRIFTEPTEGGWHDCDQCR